MNYLAHLFLSHQAPDITMGNFLGDLVRSSQIEALPETIQEGIELHRKIDSFTDHHPAVKKAVDIVQPTHRRYAPVVTDIYYDYFLSKHWTQFTDIDIQDFANWCYQLFIAKESYIPKKHKERVKMMSQHNWLVYYGDKTELHNTFMRVAKRAKFDNHFDVAIESLVTHYDTLEQSFWDFFPEVLNLSRTFVQEATSNR